MARPHVPDEERHENRIAVYLDEEDDMMLRILAKKKGIPVAVLGRALIRAQLQAMTLSGELAKEKKVLNR